jgi:hypothetical protein
LFEVVPAVDEMEFAPLANVERAEHGVAGTLAGWAEERFRFGEKEIETSESFGGGFGEVSAGEWMRGWPRGNHGRRLTACGEESASSDPELKDTMREGGFGAGGGALSQARTDGGLGAGVGEKKVLNDLLNGPLAGTRGRAKLGLGGVESVESGRNLALKLVEGGVHRRRNTLHGLRARWLVRFAGFHFLKFGECFFGGLGLFAVGVEL